MTVNQLLCFYDKVLVFKYHLYIFYIWIAEWNYTINVNPVLTVYCLHLALYNVIYELMVQQRQVIQRFIVIELPGYLGTVSINRMVISINHQPYLTKHINFYGTQIPIYYYVISAIKSPPSTIERPYSSFISISVV